MDIEVVKQYKDWNTFRAVSVICSPHDVYVENRTSKRKEMYMKIKYFPMDPEDPDSDPDHSKNLMISSFYLFKHILKIYQNPSICF